MTPPDTARLFDAIDATWPPARHIKRAPWHFREGKGGGQRVSAATAVSPVLETDIDAAEAEMRSLSQRPLFMIRPGEDDLDTMLESRNYTVVDPVTMYLGDADALAHDVPHASAIPAWPPLMIQREIWAGAGIDTARIAIMERAETPKITILGRNRDAAAGVAYVACDGGIAMLHALEVAAEARNHGVATRMMQRAAAWAASQGARWLATLVTKANGPANALYRKLGLEPVTGYHYRRAPETAS